MRKYKFKMADGRHTEKQLLATLTPQRFVQVPQTFCMKTQNPTTVTVEPQAFRSWKIQDGGRIATETLQTQTLQSTV